MGWKKNDFDIFGDFKFLCFVPPSLIHHQKRSTPGDGAVEMFQKNIHHFGVYFGKKQREFISCFRVYGGIGIQITVAGFHIAYRFHAAAAQDSSNAGLQSESRLIEEKNVKLLTGFSAFVYLLGEFF
jgi:hypothetical protein